MQLQSTIYSDFVVQQFAVLWAELTYGVEDQSQTLCFTQRLYKGPGAMGAAVTLGSSTLIHTTGILTMQLLLTIPLGTLKEESFSFVFMQKCISSILLPPHTCLWVLDTDSVLLQQLAGSVRYHCTAFLILLRSCDGAMTIITG